MSSPLSGLEPASVWSYFDEIRQIPRPSKHEEKILAWVTEWADSNGISWKQDDAGNIVANIPATAGREKDEPVILQGHVDMVPEKNSDVDHDFMTDPISLEKDGDWIVARNTTLGADNGVGVAMCMACATDPEVSHGPLELLFTIDEETGLTGANNLDASLLTSKRLVNLDTEEDGALYIGCAGGSDLHISFPLETAESQRPEQVLLAVRGLRGGHSGVDIHENRANAIKLLARVLQTALDTGLEFDLASIKGGSKHNAIPREAFADLRLIAGATEGLGGVVAAQMEVFTKEFGHIDPDLTITVQEKDVSGTVFTDALTRRLLGALVEVPHGVLAMSKDVEGLVETSNNLAVITTEENAVEVTTSSRSSVMPALKETTDAIRSTFEKAGAQVENAGGYPGWKPNPDSGLLKIAQRVFEETFGRKPLVRAIHAGLECGIIGDKIPGMDMISMGPEIRSPHAPGEKVQISSVENTWKLLKAYLKVL